MTYAPFSNRRYNVTRRIPFLNLARIWMFFHHPNTVADTSRQAEKDLLRLARTSPHLLPDLGFRQDTARQSTEHEVWISEQGDVELHLPRQPSTDCEQHSPCASAQGFRA